MANPTTSIFLNGSTPAAPSGDQNVTFQSDNATPQQSVTAYPQRATATSYGTMRINDLQQESFIYAADTGAANAYAVTLSPAPTIVAGSVVVFKAANANTGASTLAVNGGAATAIKKNVSVALASGDIAAGQIISVVYDGTNWQMVGASALPNSGVTAGSYTNANVTVNAQGIVTAASNGSAGSSSYAPIQILQSATPATGNPPLAPTFSLNVLPGSAIAVCIGFSSGSITSVTDSQSNTYTAYASGTSGAIYVATNVKGGAITVTVAGPFGSAEIFELSNVASVEGSTFGNGTSVTSVGTGSASTVYPFEFVLMSAFSSNNGVSITNANSWPSAGNNSSSLFGNQANFATTVATVGSVSNTANFSGSGNVYAGFVIFRPLENLSNPLQPTTAGKVLTANGSNTPPSFQDPAFKSLTTTGTSGAATLSAGVLNIPNYSGAGGSGALVFLEGHTASSSAELDFTSWLSVTYDVYEIHVVNLVLSATATLEWQASTNGGSSYDTGSNYRWTWTYSSPGGGGNIASSSATSINFRDINSAIEANGSINGRFTLYNPGGALFKLLTGQMSIDTSTSTTSPVMIQGSGQYRVTTAVNAFRLLVNTGNITSGTVRVYGISH